MKDNIEGIEDVDVEMHPPIKEEGVESFRNAMIRDYYVYIHKHPTKKDENFAVVESWDDVEKIMYHAVEKLVGEDTAEIMYEDNRVEYDDLENIRGSGSEIPGILIDLFEQYFGNIYFEDIIGMDWGFSDEFTGCHLCNKAIRIQTYTEPADYAFIEGSYIYCGDCIRNDNQIAEQYIESHLRNDPRHANHIIKDRFQFTDRGYERVQNIIEEEDGKYDAGWYRWNSQDEPKELYERFKDNYDVVFDVTEFTPFHTEWGIWLREKK